MDQKITSNERSFTMIVERDPESGWLVGEIVELPGCFTEAPDLPSLQTAMKEAVEGYLEVADTEEPQPEYVATMLIKVA